VSRALRKSSSDDGGRVLRECGEAESDSKDHVGMKGGGDIARRKQDDLVNLEGLCNYDDNQEGFRSLEA